jgi:hypothetical protein
VKGVDETDEAVVQSGRSPAGSSLIPLIPNEHVRFIGKTRLVLEATRSLAVSNPTLSMPISETSDRALSKNETKLEYAAGLEDVNEDRSDGRSAAHWCHGGAATRRAPGCQRWPVHRRPA